MNGVIEIIEEHSGWLAVGKPSGLSVHNAEDGYNLLSILEEQLGCKLYAAHRLDQQTSGIILLGKSSSSTQMLQEALTMATKEYTSILRGTLIPKDGVWTWPLSNKGEGFRNPQGRKNDRIEALTTYRVIRSNQYFTMVSLTLGTGRQHQIRKHTALAKHAVVGDTRYGERRYNTMIAKRYQMNDLCLCASKLEIKIDGVQYCFDVNVPTTWSALV